MISVLALIPLLALQILAYDWHQESNLFWAERCDWRGNDLNNARIRGQDCGGRCASTPGCTHFTWTGYQGGTCWMKKNGANPSQAITPNEYTVCGYMKSGPNPAPAPNTGLTYLSGPANGKSTRYWDCCKVSCGWNGKADVSSPVQSCQKNGVTGVDINAQSGCGGGPSYLCNSNQPWAINDNLAYGFAAAKLNGQGEGNWCCSCYELTFTSGPVQGKRLVVQVVNTGGDLGENHFDLQIPGGGVGIFTDGCKTQWGAPNNGWGQQYGGVTSRDQCNQLPDQIRAGCFWRFDWFKNADNPSISFRRVKCPAELTQKTGCKRRDE